MNLAFHLDVDDNTGVFDPENSYIIVDKTILFPKIPQETVNGVLTYINSLIKNDYLISSAFHLETQFPGKISSRTVSRRIVLEGIPQDEEGNTVIGTYTETISGFLPEDIIVRGDFILSRQISVSDSGTFHTDIGQKIRYADRLFLTTELHRVMRRVTQSFFCEIQIEKSDSLIRASALSAQRVPLSSFP